MRVIHLLSSTGYHGAENMAAELIRQLGKLGVTSHIGVFRSGAQSNLDIIERVGPAVEKAVVFDCRSRADLRAARVLHRYLREERIDVVHSHKYKTNVYALLARWGTRARLVSTCHNWLGTSLRMRAYAALDKRLLRRFDAVVAVSAAIASELERHVAPRKVRRVPNGIDVERFGATQQRTVAKHGFGLDDKTVVGFVGRLSPEKGLSHLLRALARVAEQRADAAALIVGDGALRAALADEARALGIAERVVFAGEQHDTVAAYAAMDLFALSSLNEGLPMVVLEAMASGVPVVATRVGEIPQVLQEGACGWLVPPGDVPALAGAIADVLSDPQAARRVAAARTRVTDHFSALSMARAYRRIYDDVFSAANMRAVTASRGEGV